MENDTKAEFYRKGDLLFVKWNGQIGDALYYTGNNSFENGSDGKVQFEIQERGAVNLNFYYTDNCVLTTMKGTRVLKYNSTI